MSPAIPPPGARRAAGLTLIELMVVVAILAITAAFGIPSLAGTIQRNRIINEAAALQGDLMFTRAEAIKRGAPVAICTSTDGATCAAGGSWNGGWIVFTNRAADGVLAAANGDQVVRAQAAWKGSDTASTSPAVSAMAFNAEGFAASVRGDTQITIRTAPVNSAATRCLSINMAGTVTAKDSTACP